MLLEHFVESSLLPVVIRPKILDTTRYTLSLLVGLRWRLPEESYIFMTGRQKIDLSFVYVLVCVFVYGVSGRIEKREV